MCNSVSINIHSFIKPLMLQICATKVTWHGSECSGIEKGCHDTCAEPGVIECNDDGQCGYCCTQNLCNEPVPEGEYDQSHKTWIVYQRTIFVP